jgi:hypothetical protein
VQVRKDLCDLRTMLCIGGVDMRAQTELIRQGVHMVISTPGRLKDHLAKKRMTLGLCKYLCLDEADRMVRQPPPPCVAPEPLPAKFLSRRALWVLNSDSWAANRRASMQR